MRVGLHGSLLSALASLHHEVPDIAYDFPTLPLGFISFSLRETKLKKPGHMACSGGAGICKKGGRSGETELPARAGASEHSQQSRMPVTGSAISERFDICCESYVVLRGRLSGYAVGLVQLLRDIPCPDILARRLLLALLADFREHGHEYLLHLARCRDEAWVNGTEDQVEALDAKIREYHIHQQMPWRLKLNFLFSQAGYEKFGDDIMPFWAVTLIQINVLEQYWEQVALGYQPTNPYLLPGFHAEEEVLSTDWLDDFRPDWTAERELGDLEGRPSIWAAELDDATTEHARYSIN